MKPKDETVAAATQSALDNLEKLIPVIAEALVDLASVARMAKSEHEQVRIVYTITSFAIDRLRDGVSAALTKMVVPARQDKAVIE